MAKDPYKYFRIEARELLEGLSQGALELEKRGVTKEVVSRLLRLAHTLKGAARVVKQREVSELAHAVEDLLAPYRDAAGEFPSDRATQLLKLIDACNEQLKPVLAAPVLDKAPAMSAPTVPTPAAPLELETGLTSIRVEIAEMDALLFDLTDAMSHLGVVLGEIARFDSLVESASSLASQFASASAPKENVHQSHNTAEIRKSTEVLHSALKQGTRSLKAGVERLERSLSSIRDQTENLRLLPARTIFPLMERIARDAADTLQKSILFEAVGGENRLEAHVLMALRDALSHVVRNAVAHGIESESKRVAAGKAPKGRVRLQVHRHGSRIHFVVEDDGGGINLPAIQDSVIAKGIIPVGVARSLGIQEATKLLLQGGLSTAPEVSEVMGRGIGLDVVRATVGKLKGDVQLHTEPGRGTSVELIVPVSIESIDVLAVDASGSRVLIPFDVVYKTMRISNEDLLRSANSASLLLEGEAVPFVPLAEILHGIGQHKYWPASWVVVFVRAKGMQAAIGVKRMIGVRNVVVRPLPPLTGPIPLVSGVSLDGEGLPELVLDASALIAAARSSTRAAMELRPVISRSVLVVDDSLTSRMLEQSILETAGFQVDVAISGEDALEKVKQKTYSLLLVDVEMPGMDGFTLIEKLQADPVLKTMPAILVTSRATAEDRKRGMQAGARDHIAKGAFEEGHLLRAIRRVLGEEST